MSTSLRAVAVWLLLVALAVLNGGLRTGLLVPRLGERSAHLLSTLLLCAAIAVVARLTMGWIGPATPAQAWGVGALWLAMTVAFEFLAGRYLFGRPWESLLADYHVQKGRVWVLVLLVTLLAPPWAARRR